MYIFSLNVLVFLYFPSILCASDGSGKVYFEVNIFHGNNNATHQFLRQNENVINYKKGTFIELQCIMSLGLTGVGLEPLITLTYMKANEKKKITSGYQEQNHMVNASFILNENYDGSTLQCDAELDGKQTVTRTIQFVLVKDDGTLPTNNIFAHILIALGSFVGGSIVVIIIMYIYQRMKSRSPNRLLQNESRYDNPVVFGVVNPAVPRRSPEAAPYVDMLGA